jgi:pyruvate-ferredoxin/flavodoxin oxidoreductase
MKNANLVLLTDYRGISVADVTELRKKVREADAEYMVIKNNITRRALAECGITGLDKELAGPTAVILANDAYLPALKAIYNYSKKNDFYQIKGGVLEGKVSSVEELKVLKDYIPTKSVWIIGGDGWSYDIGFGGLDHIMSSNENVNILVLDTEIYSNTGGQSSKSTREGAVAKFNSIGKNTTKKDLARMMMTYPNVYVAEISMGANMNQAIKAINEAMNHDGPSMIIAYAPCISHGIKGGMGNSMKEEELAVKCGYFPLFRYNSKTKEFNLDYKEPDFTLYDEFLSNETRYKMISAVNLDMAKELLESNLDMAKERFEYYKSLDK